MALFYTYLGSTPLPTDGGDNPSGNAFSHPMRSDSHSIVGNVGAHSDVSCPSPQSLQDTYHAQQILLGSQAAQEAFQEATRLARLQQQQIRAQAAVQRQIERMQQCLDSGDPILVAEAMAWAQVNPGVLHPYQLHQSRPIQAQEQPPNPAQPAQDGQSQLQEEGNEHSR